MSISYSAYLYLIAAAAFEVLWVLCVRLSDGFSRLLPSGLAAVSMFLSVLLLAKASQQLPVALAYCGWVGMGAIGSALLQEFYFQQPLSAGAWLSLLMLLVGIFGLQLTLAPQH